MVDERIEILKSANEYLYNLENGIEKLVKLIQEEREQEAILIIPQISDGIDWIINAIDLTRSIQKEKIKINDINEHLGSIVEALENEDYILLGDIFNYEILPILDEVHNGVMATISN